MDDLTCADHVALHNSLRVKAITLVDGTALCAQCVRDRQAADRPGESPVLVEVDETDVPGVE